MSRVKQSFVTLAAAFSAQALGVAQAALDFIVDTARTQKAGPIGALMRDRPVLQAQVAAHAAALSAARGELHRRMGVLWMKAEANVEVQSTDLAEVYGASLHADAVAREAADAMYALGGTSSLCTASPLERAHRDLHAMLRHVVAQPAMLEDAGRVMVGLAPTNPQFAL